MLGDTGEIRLPDKYPGATIAALERTGWAAEIYDSEWKLRWVSPELRNVLGEPTEHELGLGLPIVDAYLLPVWRRVADDTSSRKILSTVLPYYLHDSGEDADEVQGRMPRNISQLFPLDPRKAPDIWSTTVNLLQGDLPPASVSCINVRFRESDFSGWARVYGSGMRASVLSLVARGSEDMFERMSRLVTPGRQPVAILFCDLANSSELARQLPSPLYFQLLSALAKAIDDVVVRHDGVVGKHAGDGASAYYLADDHGDVSAAVRAAIVSAREIAEAWDGLQNEMLPSEVHRPLNTALHWGATVYMGQIVSGGRLEVTALGEEVNECARMEQVAHGGSILASKHFLERLAEGDAEDLRINLSSILYKPLSELENLSGKQEEDIGRLPVADIS